MSNGWYDKAGEPPANRAANGGAPPRPSPRHAKKKKAKEPKKAKASRKTKKATRKSKKRR